MKHRFLPSPGFSVKSKLLATRQFLCAWLMLALSWVQAGEINVLGPNGVKIFAGDLTPAVADETFFGVSVLGDGSVSKTFTIQNTDGYFDLLNLNGSPRVVIGGEHPQEFEVTQLPDPFLFGGTSTTFEVTWTPTAGGIRDAIISIPNDDSNENPYTFAIQGTARLKLNYTAGSFGSLSGVPSQVRYFGQSGSPVEAIPEEDYYFVDWSDGSTENPRTDIAGSQNLNVTANFAIKTFRVTYSSNDHDNGGALIDLADYEIYDEVTVLDPGFIGYTGHTFQGWNTQSDGSGTAYNVGDTFLIESDVTLYAQWQIIPAEIIVTQEGPLTDGASLVDFGSHALGVGGAPVTFTITNSGFAPLESLAASVDGPGSAYFTVSALSSTTVAGGSGSATFTVSFLSDSEGAQSATLRIASNVAGDQNPFDIDLTGTVSTPLVYTSNGSEITITDCDPAASGPLVVPPTIDGLPVTKIGDRAFYQCSQLTDIAISEGVTSFGNDAFRACSGLERLTIPSTVSSTGSQCFTRCRNLVEFVVSPASNRYSSDGPVLFEASGTVLAAYPSVTGSYTVPPQVTVISGQAFYECSGLTEVTIPEGVRTIGPDAFAGCWGLTSITLPDSLTTLGHSVFRGCSNLATATLPQNLTRVPSYLFLQCHDLAQLTLPSTVTRIDLGAFRNCNSLASLTLPPAVTFIRPSAFLNCSSLVSISIPAAVEEIQNEAFRGCTNLTSVFVEGALPTVGTDVFKDTAEKATALFVGTGSPVPFSGLTAYPMSVSSSGTEVTITDIHQWVTGNVIIPAAIGGAPVTRIGANAFESCGNVEAITLPDGLTSIGDSAFRFCQSLASINLPNTITRIERRAFVFCSSLNDITLPPTITRIEEDLFTACVSLTALTIPPGVTSIGPYAISRCDALTSIDLPNSLTSIEFRSFWRNSGLTNIIIPEGVTSIGPDVFLECTNLTSISLPSSLTSIGSGAFSRCSSLASIPLPANLESVGASAFSFCTNLTSISIPASLTTLEESAFRGCSSLATFHGDPASQHFSTSGPALFEKAMTLLLAYPTASGHYTIPSTVVSIAAWAFAGATNLTEVTIPLGVTSLGEGVFSDATSLSQLIIPPSVTNIGRFAFGRCSSLGAMTIPASVTSLGDFAFAACTSLSTVVIEPGLTLIPWNAFASCIALQWIQIPSTVSSIHFSAFENCISLSTIHLEGNAPVISGGLEIFEGVAPATVVEVTDPAAAGFVYGGTYGGLLVQGLDPNADPYGTGVPNLLTYAFFGTDRDPAKACGRHR